MNPEVFGFSFGGSFNPIESVSEEFDSDTIGGGYLICESYGGASNLQDGTFLIGELMVGTFSRTVQYVQCKNIIYSSSFEGIISGHYIDAECDYHCFSVPLDNDHSNFKDGDRVSFDIRVDGFSFSIECVQLLKQEEEE